MFLNLRSVIVEVDDLEDAKGWYTRVLDSKPMIDGPDMVTFSIGGDRLVLQRVDHIDRNSRSGAVAYWGVSDVKAEYQRLIDLGAREDGGIRDMGRGILAARLTDPFGNAIGIGGTGGKPDNRAIEEKPSKTALWTTLMRAFAAGEPNADIAGPDTMAEIFLPAEMRTELYQAKDRQAFREKHFVIGICEYVMARTRLFDRFYRQALERGIEQIVLLGAGYDSRPYRFNPPSGRVRIFELDIPPTQTRKKRCLARAGIVPPDSITYVPINFNTQSLKAVLSAAGFNPAVQTLFVWEGVTYYLAPDAVDATLAFIKTRSAPGSWVAFDYIGLWPGIFDAYGVRELIQYNSTRQSGESGAGFSVEADKIESFLLERGFAMDFHQDPSDLQKNFLTLPDGSLFGRVTSSLRIVRAVTMA